MIIGVISDTHDRLDLIARAIRTLKDRGAELILHCGDVSSTEALRLFAPIPTRIALGNWDRPTGPLRDVAAEIGAAIHDLFGEIELSDRKIAWTHGHRRAIQRDLEESGRYDLVFHGHTHVPRLERRGPTLIANPGAFTRVARKTCLLVDLTTLVVEQLEVT